MHLIRKLQKSNDVKSVREYNRKTGKTTTFSYSERPAMIKQYKETTALEFRIYIIDRMPENFKPWFRKLKRLTIIRKEVNWLLKKEVIRTQADARKFINNLSGLMKSHTYITFGDEAVKEMKGMPEHSLSSMRVIYGIDTYGVLDEVQKRRKTLAQRI